MQFTSWLRSLSSRCEETTSARQRYRKARAPKATSELRRTRFRPWAEVLEDRNAPSASAAGTAPLAASYLQTPLSFQANVGQADPSVQFLSQGSGYSLGLTATEASLALLPASPPASLGLLSTQPPPPPQAATLLHMQLVGANAAAQGTALDEQTAKTNYVAGNDPSQWQLGVANYGKVQYQGVYNGINVVYYGTNQQQLEYDFTVAPGANAGQIQLQFTGQQGMALDSQGNLVLHTGAGDLIEHAPVAYQVVDGVRQGVSAQYVLEGDGQVGFAVGSYDPHQALVIDPILVYSTLVGGSSFDAAFALSLDSSGNIYIGGVTFSTTFPGTSQTNPAAPTLPRYSGFVSKLSSSGELLWSTFLFEGFETGVTSIAVDSSGNSYISIGDYPNGNFVVKLDSTGTPLWSDHLDWASRVVLDSSGAIDVAGYTVDDQNKPHLSVGKLDSSGALLWHASDISNATVADMAVDSSGNIYVTGQEGSPTVPGASDAFVANVSSSGALLWSTLVGDSTSPDEGSGGTGIALDSTGSIYLAGNMNSTTFPGTSQINAGAPNIGDAFVSKLNSSGTLLWSTLVGGDGGVSDDGGIAMDSSGDIYISGIINSTTLAGTSQTANPSLQEGFVSKLDSSGALLWSYLVGGSGNNGLLAMALDSTGNIYVAGGTDSPSFPGTSQTNAGWVDAFVAKLVPVPNTPSSILSSLQSALSTSSSVTLEANSSAEADAILSAVNNLAPSNTPETVTLDLIGGTWGDLQASPPAGVTLVITGDGSTTTIVGHSPALTVAGGSVVVSGVNFTTATDAPTILLSGGSLTLRNDVVQSSTGFADAAIAVTGGTLDLGTVTDPGNNIINVNGAGEAVHNTTPNPISAVGNTFESNGTPQPASFLTFTALTASAASSPFGQALTLTASVRGDTTGSPSPSGIVDFFDTTTNTVLGSVSLSGGSATLTTATLPVGNQIIIASYGGDANFLPSRDTLTVPIVESIYVLNSTTSGTLNVSGNAGINIPGLLMVDSKSSTAVQVNGNAHVSASSIQVVGSVQATGNAGFSVKPVTGAVSVFDPERGVVAPNVSNNQGSVNLSGTQALTINPGVYSSIKVSGSAQLTMNPGVYVIAGGGFTVTGNASVSGSGVMIYNAGSNYSTTGMGGNFGGITLACNGAISLTAPSTGIYAGVLIFQERDNNRAIALGGNGVTGLSGGLIYAPQALLAVSGNAQLQHVPLIVGELQLSGNAASTLTSGSDSTNSTAGQLLAGDLSVYVDNSNGYFSSDELAQIQDAINNTDALLAPYGVTVSEVSDPSLANLTLDSNTSSACGGMADGVLGCFNMTTSEITLVQGWNWYAGSDPSAIGPGQYSFETTVTHELGHALGLGGSPDPNSPMFETLPAGVVKGGLTVADLSLPPLDTTNADALTAAGFGPDTDTILPATTPTPVAVAHTADASANVRAAAVLPQAGVVAPGTPTAGIAIALTASPVRSDLAAARLIAAPGLVGAGTMPAWNSGAAGFGTLDTAGPPRALETTVAGALEELDYSDINFFLKDSGIQDSATPAMGETPHAPEAPAVPAGEQILTSPPEEALQGLDVSAAQAMPVDQVIVDAILAQLGRAWPLGAGVAPAGPEACGRKEAAQEGSWLLLLLGGLAMQQGGAKGTTRSDLPEHDRRRPLGW
jgi:hypothetical protein